MTPKQHRVDEANKVIEAIARHGRRFFYCGPGTGPARAKACPEGRVARFELGPGGHIHFRDDYSWKPIYVAKRGEWSGWSHGGTLRDLVRALAKYIRTGVPINAYYFGPWEKRCCDGDLWGYGDDMVKVRCEVAQTEAVATWTSHIDDTSYV